MPINFTLTRAARILLAAACLAGSAALWAHSVGQVQTTKFFAPETVQLLVDRATNGTPGLTTGDTVSYIVQFSPVPNGANTGVMGYITDYIPPGTVVTSASIVAKDGAGNYTDISPSLPGGIDFGWGNRGVRTFLAPFNTAAYDATGRCAAAGFTNNCEGKLTELHADTGIFYSTDPRTAQFPAQPARIVQSTNGYNINPTASGQLNPIIGQTIATTHNLWDASMANAFGSTAAAVGALAAPASAQAALGVGTGAAPFNTASPVAGPLSGYQLDYTANVGPWQRIAYVGSRIADNSSGPATAANLSFTAVGGFATSSGYGLSSSNPLPAGTNAVRWAVGKLVVGEIRYVRISLRLTAPVPSGGITNASEVFGGDAGDGDNGQDNPWRYHIPSVADNNSNLFVTKTVVCVFSGATCVSSNGGYIPANAKLRYRVVYLNSGNLSQTNVALTETLPCQTAANASTVTAIISGPIAFPAPNPPATVAGNCGTGVRGSFTFATLSALAAGAGGSIEIDVQTNAATNDIVLNTVKLVSTQVPAGVTANAVSSVQAAPFINVSKSTATPVVSPGGTVSYVIGVSNSGTGNATALSLYDILPSLGGALSANTRFGYSSTISITLDPANPPGSVLPAPVISTAIPPTLTPYDSASGAANTQQVLWNFGGTSVLVPGASFTLTFTANVGISVTASATPYRNSAALTYTGGSGRADASGVAPVTVVSPLNVTKTIDCYYVGTSCVAYNGSGQIPVNAKVRYLINYANTGASAIANAVLSDTLPCQTLANAATVTAIISGPIASPSPNPPVTAAGNCPATRASFSFPAATIGAGQTGSIALEVQTSVAAGTSTLVVNTAILAAAGFPTAQSDVQATAYSAAVLQITKTPNSTRVNPGGTLSYTINVTNSGTGNASAIKLYDWLPTSSPTLDPTTRFSFATGSSVFGGSIVAVVPTVVIPPTQAPYNNVPAGSNPNLNNQQEIAWDFGAQTLAPGSSFSLTFVAQAGSAIALTSPPTSYANVARAVHSGGQTNSGDASASVTLLANLSITKSNATTTLTAGQTTSYSIVATNGGPSPANGTTVKDPAVTGLVCTSVTCTTTGSATCPSPIDVATLQAAGLVIPLFPSGATVTLLLGCGVTATGVP